MTGRQRRRRAGGAAAGQNTLKPEIAAPGVAISAASAGGRGVYAYRSMSGTSMAAPHVAGAAAVVKQGHPDWTAQQIKAALVSSAKASVPGDVRETGGGRLDVQAAVDTTVTGAAALQGGSFDWPQDRGDRTTVDVPYTNSGDRAVRLDLAVRGVTGNDGSAVRSPLARLGARSVTVPAGATVTVPLNLDPSARLERAQYGDVTGRVLATADGVTVSTPFSLYVQPETVTLRVELLDRDGRPADGASSLDVIGTDTASGERRFNDGAAGQVYRVRPGSYFLSSYVTSADGSVSYLGRPRTEVGKDTTVVLDARTAHRLDIATDRKSEVRTGTLGFARSWDTWLHAGTITGSRAVTGYYADVRGRAEEGDFEFVSYWRAYAPLIEELTVDGGPELHPVAASVGSVNLDGTGEAGLADAGSGTPAELEAAGVKGGFALVRLPDDSTNAVTVARDAEAAGALAVVVHRTAARRMAALHRLRDRPAPGPRRRLGTGGAAAGTARRRSGHAPVEGHRQEPVRLQPELPPDRPRHLGPHLQGARREARQERVHLPGDGCHDRLHGRCRRPPARRRPGVRLRLRPGAGAGRAPRVLHARRHRVGALRLLQLPLGRADGRPAARLPGGEKREETWYGGVLAPTAPRDASGAPALAAERQGNLIGVAPAFWGDSEHVGMAGSFGDIGGMRLVRDGEEIGRTAYPFGVFDVPAGDAAYELTMSSMKIGSPARVWKRSTRVETTWSFRSRLDEDVYSQGVPLLFPGYGLPEDGLKTVAARDGLRIALSATGHAGYEPGALTAAKLSYSYDGGETWNEAATERRGDDAWTATVDHAGAAGTTVTLRTELTDAHGNSVSQLVTDAYAVR